LYHGVCLGKGEKELQKIVIYPLIKPLSKGMLIKKGR
jgi:hypothetical protein